MDYNDLLVEPYICDQQTNIPAYVHPSLFGYVGNYVVPHGLKFWEIISVIANLYWSPCKGSLVMPGGPILYYLAWVMDTLCFFRRRPVDNLVGADLLHCFRHFGGCFNHTGCGFLCLTLNVYIPVCGIWDTLYSIITSYWNILWIVMGVNM